jgi:hypothetical protein
MIESATLAARVSRIRSSVLGGSAGHTRIEMLAIGMATDAANAGQ